MAAQQAMQDMQNATTAAQLSMQLSQPDNLMMTRNANVYAGFPYNIGGVLSLPVAPGIVKPGTKVPINFSRDRYAQIYYTTDGWTPTTESTRYRSPLRINATTRLQAMALEPDSGRRMYISANYEIAGGDCDPAGDGSGDQFADGACGRLGDDCAGRRREGGRSRCGGEGNRCGGGADRGEPGGRRCGGEAGVRGARDECVWGGDSAQRERDAGRAWGEGGGDRAGDGLDGYSDWGCGVGALSGICIFWRCGGSKLFKYRSFDSPPPN